MENKLILSISHVNPRSLDINLNEFSNDMVFAIYLEDGTKFSDLKVTFNTINLNENSKTLYLDVNEEDPNIDSLLLKPNVSYTLKITKNNILLEDTLVTFKDYPAPLVPNVSSYGNRLIQVNFEYPIKHLIDSTTSPGSFSVNSTSFSLTNFYIKYFNTDISQGTSANPLWTGYIITDITTTPNISLSKPFTVTMTPDSRSLLIQSNVKSLPIGDHVLQIATSKIADHGLYGKHLSDFSYRDVPISEVGFSLSAAQYSALVKNVTIVDPQTVEVRFTAPILSSFGKITVDKVSSVSRALSHDSETVTRKETTLDTLIFKMANDAFISSGTNTITISGVIDAYGLIISDYVHTANLELPSPELLSVIQDKNYSNNSGTKVNLTFSHEMNSTSANIASNYIITKKGGTTKFSVASINIGSPSNNISLIIEPQLSSGEYTLTVENLVDIYGSTLINNIKDFTVIDVTKPTVIKILGTVNEGPPDDLNDSILIKFSEHMKVNAENGIDNGENFKLANDRLNYISLKDTKTTVLMENSWVRFNLGGIVPLSATTDAESLVKLGHVGLDKIFYVTDESGNIVDFCEPKIVNKLLPILDLKDGSAAITDSNQITYTLPTNLDPDQMFDIIAFKDDFIFKSSASSTPLKISDVTVSDNLRSLVFTFDNPKFSSGIIYKMTLVTLPETVMTEDILNRPIILSAEITVTNDLRPEVTSISTVWVDNLSEPNEAILALMLSTPVTRTHINDFIVYNGFNTRLNVSKATIVDSETGNPSPSGNVIELTCKSPINTNALTVDLLVSTAPEAYRYTSRNGLKLKDIVNQSSIELYPLSGNVILDNTAINDLSKASLEVVFSDNIKITESVDDTGVIPITGEIIQSEGPNPNDQDGPKLNYLSLKFENILELRSDIPAITIPSGSFTATLRVSNNKLIIKFITVSDINLLFTEFTYFELLPIGYKLLSLDTDVALNESVTVKLPFNFAD